MTLKQTEVGEIVKVVKLNGQGAIKRRIMDMGITKGTEILIRKVAPLGDPLEINLRGYELTLRKIDAEIIEVEKQCANELAKTNQMGEFYEYKNCCGKCFWQNGKSNKKGSKKTAENSACWQS